MFGAHAAEAILASDPMAASTGRTYGSKDPIIFLPSPLQGGAVHIWSSKTASVFGAHAAEAILASDPMAASTGRTYGSKDPIIFLPSPLQGGAVHIWLPSVMQEFSDPY
ncbi:hypothetical protein A4S02_05915 [Acetobacter ascendens]|uniref:Uncharacterized protein n=1 Tax=Acetobacter ascendens TaxID=481146 RepID=A0A1D8QVK9_9PROT|nr:hypothetical protein A4S02_05915 [Acetobacter ascendens]